MIRQLTHSERILVSMMGTASVKLRDTRTAEVVTSTPHMSAFISGHAYIIRCFVDCEILWTYCGNVLQISKMSDVWDCFIF